MYELKLAWRNLVNRPVQTLITLTVVALAVALAITVIHLNEGLQRGIIRASDPFGMLVVGAKGSGQQLVVSTLLLQGTPVGNIDGHIFEELRNDPRVALAVPIAMGDNIGGARIIGTDAHFFDLRSSQQAPPSFQLAEGRLFEADYEAVLGSRAGAELGLRIGDHFRPAHGVEPGLEGDDHAEVHTVVGILHRSDTPFDNAAFTTVNSVIQMHAEVAPEMISSTDSAAMDTHTEESDHDSTGLAGAATSAETAGHEADEQASNAHGEDHDDHDHAANEHGANEHGEAHDDHDHVIEGQVTAVLVAPVGFVEANQLWRDFYVGTEAQAVFPGRELGGLFDLLNQGQEILIVVGYLAAIMAALTLFLAIYSATESRQHLLAILRGVGASRRTVVLVVLVETVLVALLGALLGRLLGYGAAAAIAAEISRRSAIPVAIGWLPQVEPVLWLLPLALGVLAGLLPAWQAYRVNVVEKLFPS